MTVMPAPAPRRGPLGKRTPALGLFFFSLVIFLALHTAACTGGQTSATSHQSSGQTSPASPASPAARQGFVSINFDDGYESAYLNGLPILDKAGFKTTQFIITRFLDHTDFLTTNQMLAMSAAGHEIGAHTRSHPHLPTLDADQQKTEILGSFDDLVSLGIRPQVFAYPFGEYDANCVVVAGSIFAGARTVFGGSDDKSVNPLLLNAYSIHPGAPVYAIGDITRLIDTAQSNGTWLILVFHRVDEEVGDGISVPHDLIQQIADYLTAKKVRVVTTTEGLQLDLNPSLP